jgi:hypothetical protein
MRPPFLRVAPEGCELLPVQAGDVPLLGHHTPAPLQQVLPAGRGVRSMAYRQLVKPRDVAGLTVLPAQRLRCSQLLSSLLLQRLWQQRRVFQACRLGSRPVGGQTRLRQL